MPPAAVLRAHAAALLLLAAVASSNRVAEEPAAVVSSNRVAEVGRRVRLLLKGNLVLLGDHPYGAKGFVKDGEVVYNFSSWCLAGAVVVPAKSVFLNGLFASDPRSVDMRKMSVTVELYGTLARVYSQHWNTVYDIDREDGFGALLGVGEDCILSVAGGTEFRLGGITRAGVREEVHEQLVHLSKQQLNKEFVIDGTFANGEDKFPSDFVVFHKTGGLCGIELFSQNALTCNAIETAFVQTQVSRIAHLRPATPRGFSFEFELVSRSVTPEVNDSSTEEFKNSPLPESVEKAIELHAWNYNNQAAYRSAVKQVQQVNWCFRNAIRGKDTLGTGCKAHSDCRLSQFCSKGLVCSPRSNCGSELPPVTGGQCPVPLSRWFWETDVTITTLNPKEVNLLNETVGGVAADEGLGVGMEIVAPGPPHVLSGDAGLASVAELLAVLRHMGVQSGPSQGLHVHINAVSKDAPGTPLSIKGIASVWAAWAEYQLVLDEMLSPGRPDNMWAMRLFLAAQEPSSRLLTRDFRADPTRAVAVIFQQMHTYLKTAGRDGDPEDVTKEDLSKFCNAVFRDPRQASDEPCSQAYPTQRYFQLNLIPLTRYGTIEFRSHSATSQPERVARWVQFLTGFVEFYGATAEGLARTARYFDGAWEEDFKELRASQRSASFGSLFSPLKQWVDKDTQAYYEARAWEAEDRVCKAELLRTASESGLVELRPVARQLAESDRLEGVLALEPREFVVPMYSDPNGDE